MVCCHSPVERDDAFAGWSLAPLSWAVDGLGVFFECGFLFQLDVALDQALFDGDLAELVGGEGGWEHDLVGAAGGGGCAWWGLGRGGERCFGLFDADGVGADDGGDAAFFDHCGEVVCEAGAAEDVCAGAEPVALGTLFGFEADAAFVGSALEDGFLGVGVEVEDQGFEVSGEH